MIDKFLKYLSGNRIKELQKSNNNLDDRIARLEDEIKRATIDGEIYWFVRKKKREPLVKHSAAKCRGI